MNTTQITFLFLALSLAAVQAHAQYLVKRVKCSDAEYDHVESQVEQFQQVPTHLNISGNPKNLHVQVVRDTCRPRAIDGGTFRLVRKSGDVVAGSIPMHRNSKIPSSVMLSLSSGQYGVMAFESTGGIRISGTFDYMYSWE